MQEAFLGADLGGLDLRGEDRDLEGTGQRAGTGWVGVGVGGFIFSSHSWGLNGEHVEL